MARRYQDGRVIVRAFEQARERAEVELRQLDLTIDRSGTHPTALVGPALSPRRVARRTPRHSRRIARDNRDCGPLASPATIRFSWCGWTNRKTWRWCNRRFRRTRTGAIGSIKIDLVILNQQGTTYGQELRGQLQRVLVRQNSEDWFNRRGGIFILYADQLSEADRVLLETAARVVLDGAKGSLAQQLQALHKQATRLPPFVAMPPDSAPEATPPLARPSDLVFDNGLGGFSADGREYVIYLEPGQWTPAPWINVIANPDFGFTVSETGAGYTWSGNSSENRLTPWSNDPVTDPPGEAIYLRDEETAEVWSPTPAAVSRAGAVPDSPRRRLFDFRAQQSRTRPSACGSLPPRMRRSR